jgi:hypothetical protein
VQHQQNPPQSTELVKAKVTKINLDIEMEIGTGNLPRAASEKENQRLIDQVTAFEAKIEHREKAQRIEPHSKSDASVARRVTSPGSTLPPP